MWIQKPLFQIFCQWLMFSEQNSLVKYERHSGVTCLKFINFFLLNSHYLLTKVKPDIYELQTHYWEFWAEVPGIFQYLKLQWIKKLKLQITRKCTLLFPIMFTEHQITRKMHVFSFTLPDFILNQVPRIKIVSHFWQLRKGVK